MGRIWAWWRTPVRPRTRGGVVVSVVLAAVDGAVRADKTKRLEARIGALEAEIRRQKGDLT